MVSQYSLPQHSNFLDNHTTQHMPLVLPSVSTKGMCCGPPWSSPRNPERNISAWETIQVPDLSQQLYLPTQPVFHVREKSSMKHRTAAHMAIVAASPAAKPVAAVPGSAAAASVLQPDSFISVEISELFGSRFRVFSNGTLFRSGETATKRVSRSRGYRAFASPANPSSSIASQTCSGPDVIGGMQCTSEEDTSVIQHIPVHKRLPQLHLCLNSLLHKT